MATSRKNLFSRLTSLFRSGPVVKRRIQNIKGSSPTQTSSAIDFFRKSSSNVYPNALNGYGNFDRLCVSSQTKIAVPGKEGFITISELGKLYPNGEKFIVYSYDHKNKQIIPAWAHDARCSGVKETVKITFDDGSELICTPDHPCMLRNGEYVDAGKLVSGMSMMPFYRKAFNGKSTEDGKDFKNYRSILTFKGKNGWTPEHKLIAYWFYNQHKKENECVHHIHFIPFNNSPENLKIMNVEDHKELHSKLMIERWKDEEWRENTCQKMKDSYTDERRKKLIEYNKLPETIEKRRNFCLSENNVAKRDDVKEKISITQKKRYEDPIEREKSSIRTKELYKSGILVPNKEFIYYNKGKHIKQSCAELSIEKIIETYNTIDTRIGEISKHLDVSWDTIKKFLNKNGFKGWREFHKEVLLKQNHKVLSVEYYGQEEVWDLTVDGFENFATDSIIVHNSRLAEMSEMDTRAEIHQALNIYAEESMAEDAKGRSLHVYSENKNIQRLLEELFYDTLNFEFVGRSWVRNLTKYGDFFLFVDVSTEHGVINVHPVPVNEITREEGYDKDNPFAVRFRWETQGNQVLQNWQITHFRLMGNDAYSPYGCSLLDGARGIWRRLILAEDMMLSYRVLRSPERRVFYIDVGNAPPDDVPNILEAARATLKTQEVADKQQGRGDLRYNCLDLNTLIPVLDGRILTLSEIIEEYKTNKNIKVWSNDHFGNPVVGDVSWAGITKKNTEIVRVHLDNGTYIDSTPDHKFMIRDGSYIQAKDLQKDQSLMPFYKKDNKVWSSLLNDYIEVKEKSLLSIVPDMIQKYWDFDKNNISPNDISFGSGKKVHLFCKECGKSWESFAYNFSKRKGCASCGQKEANKKTLKKKLKLGLSLGDKNKELLSFWDYDLNTISPFEITYKSHKEVYWKCDKDPTHCWVESISQLTDERREDICKFCSGRKVNEENNNLLIKRPDLALEWNIEKNIDFTPGSIHVNSVLKVWWKCSICSYEWECVVQKRTCRNYGCPKCKPASFRSKIESKISELLRNEIQFDPSEHRIKTTRIENVDIVIPSINTIVEYDGWYYHKDNERIIYDTQKTERLKSFGWNVIRIRENLPVISEKDIVVPRHPNINKCVNLVLDRINQIKDNTLNYNHKVVKVEYLENTVDTGCITVEKYHNFALTNGVYVHNSYGVDIDYFIARRGSESTTTVETLPGGVNTTAIEDVQYLQSQLFAALGVPKPYLQYDENLGSKASLAQLDLRFSRTINQIQKVIITELNKIAAIHLYSNGYDGDDLVNFSLQLSNPSTIAIQQKLELWRTRFEIAGMKPEGLLDSRFIYKNVMDLTDDQIDEIKKGQLLDAKSSQSLEDLGAEGGPTAGGGFGGGGSSAGLGEPGDLNFGDFGGDEGGEPSVGEEPNPGEEGTDEEGSDEEETEDIFASDDSDEDKPLLKDEEADFIESPISEDEGFPIKGKSEISRSKHNLRRRRHMKGASQNMMPKLSDILSVENDSFDDPYDDRNQHFLKSPFKESNFPKARIDKELRDSLKLSLKRDISINKDKLLSEVYEREEDLVLVDESVDDSIEEVDRDDDEQT